MAHTHSAAYPVFVTLKRFFSSNNLVILLTIAAIASAVATYIAITGSSSPYGPDPQNVTGLILLNLALLVSLAILIVRRAYALWGAMRQGSVGSRLQTRIIVMASLVAIVPTIMVAIFSILFFNYGIQAWFDQRVRTALEASTRVAEGYLAEHKKVIRADALAMANDLNREVYRLADKPGLFNKLVNGQAALRSLTEAIVFQQGTVLARADLSFSLAFERLPADSLEKAESGEVAILTSEDEDRVRALVKLDAFITPTYLLVGRFVDPEVLEYMEQTQGAVAEYNRLKAHISDIEVRYSVVFVLVAVLLLLAAVSYGMLFAGKLAKPLSRLVTASERIRAGDFTVRVREGPEGDEIGALARAFNRMTSQLQSQRNDLIEANRQLDERRRFSEMVLAGVSAGVVALDPQHRVTHFNRSALTLLKTTSEAIEEEPFETVVPEMKALLEQVAAEPDKAVHGDIELERHGANYIFHVRIAVEREKDRILSYIVTFDDITEFVKAQRAAAWADVARRIAHEIKNPLTPIQLAVERLRRKYGDRVGDERENFDRYTETISRHVRDIGKIVEEFARFARMPSPVFRQEDLREIVQKSVFSEECRHENIAFEVDMPESPVCLSCDAGQMRQVLTNLLKNAAESIKTREGAEGGKITIRLSEETDEIQLVVSDDGAGFSKELLARATEPYITSKGKGSGLGLAIVKKIVEDHHGKMTIANRKPGGARVSLVFSK